MNDLVYPRERVLGVFTLLIGLLVWLLLVVGTFGVALIVLLLGFVVYLFVQSTLIAHIKGNGVALSEAQFPDLHAQFVACCEQLQMKERPQAYVMNGNGGLNAFATEFLRSQYVVLLSDVVDAMRHHPDGVRFYIGHELGHLRMKHLSWQFLRWPVLWLPLVGAAYSRARESTCDRHGAACSSSADNAARAIAALAAGGRRWQQLDVSAYLEQAKQTSGFWMSFHELTGAYPWLTKRVWRVIDRDAVPPARHKLAYVLAAFIPYAGRLGGGFGFLILLYVVGVMAAIANPGLQRLHGEGPAHASGDAVAKRTRCVGRVLPAPRACARVVERGRHPGVPARRRRADARPRPDDADGHHAARHARLLAVGIRQGPNRMDLRGWPRPAAGPGAVDLPGADAAVGHLRHASLRLHAAPTKRSRVISDGAPRRSGGPQ